MVGHVKLQLCADALPELRDRYMAVQLSAMVVPGGIIKEGLDRCPCSQAWPGMDKCSQAWTSVVWPGMAGHGLAWSGTDKCSQAWSCMARHGQAWLDMDVCSQAWTSMARHGHAGGILASRGAAPLP